MADRAVPEIRRSEVGGVLVLWADAPAPHEIQAVAGRLRDLPLERMGVENRILLAEGDLGTPAGWGESGFVVYVWPQLWRGGEKATWLVDELVPAEIVIDMGDDPPPLP